METKQINNDKIKNMKMRRAIVLLIGVMGVVAQTAPAQDAESILRETGTVGGLIVHLGCGDGALALALHAGPGYLVQGLEADPALVAKARERIQASGCYGRVSVRHWNRPNLPYTDNYIRLLVVSGETKVSREEMERALVPGGVLILANPKSAINNQKWIKPWPKEMDIWTHYLHSANNNPVGGDRLVAPPTQLQWTTEPKYYRSHSWNKSIVGMVTANGRTYHIEDRGPRGTLDTRFPEKWFVVCRDAFSGVELWTVPLGPKWGWREWEETGPQPFQKVAMGPIAGLWTMPVPNNRRVVTDPKRDVVFVTLEYRAPITVLDGKTGKILKTFDKAGNVDEIIQAEDGTLIVRARDIAVRKTPYGAKTRKEMMDEFFPEKPDRVVAMNPDTGAVLWSVEAGHLSPQCLAVQSGAVALYNYKELQALDQQTGAVRWKVEIAPAGRKDEKTGVFYHGNRQGGRLMMHTGKVFFSGSGDLQAFDAVSGKPLWTGRVGGVGGGAFDYGSWLYLADGLIWTASINGGCFGTNPETGKKEREVDIGKMLVRGHHPRCLPPKATENFLITNCRGAEFIDLHGNNHAAPDWIHSGCGHGAVPANGLLYDMPDPCQCYKGSKMPGLNAYAGGTPRLTTPPPPAQRLEKGPAYARSQKSEVRSQKSEVRSQKSEVRSQKSE